VVQAHAGAVSSVALSPDGGEIASASASGCSISVWDAATGCGAAPLCPAVHGAALTRPSRVSLGACGVAPPGSCKTRYAQQRPTRAAAPRRCARAPAADRARPRQDGAPAPARARGLRVRSRRRGRRAALSDRGDAIVPCRSSQRAAAARRRRGRRLGRRLPAARAPRGRHGARVLRRARRSRPPSLPTVAPTRVPTVHSLC